MSIFHIWNPFVMPDDPQSVSFVLTRGDAFGVNKGTKEFVGQLLSDIGIEAQAKSWTVEHFRSKYYTDFLGEDDWRDNWQLLWRIQIVTSKKIGRLPKTELPWIETDATDESWETAPDDDDATVGCLVVADFSSEASLEKAEKAILDDDDSVKIQKKYDVGKPEFSRAEVLGKFPQLQIDLGQFPGKFFASGADYAERVMELCVKAKGTTHFAERM
jgi:hypothetical protein